MIEIASQLTLLLFLWIFMASFLKAKNNASKKFNILDYLMAKDIKISSNTIPRANFNIQLAVKENIKQKPKAKTKEQEKSLDQKLINDCKLAMKAIGVDSKQMKYLIDYFFHQSLNPPTTVEDFLKAAFH